MPTRPQKYLSQFAETMPEWLANYNGWDRSAATNFMKSRTVFYPGGREDGHPFRVFGASHAAHCFLYADYGITKETVLASLAPNSPLRLKGYRLAFQQDLTETDLSPGGWQSHIEPSDWTNANQGWVKDWMRGYGVQPYGVLCIFDRETQYGNDHGPKRLALIYLGADGIATYDALYCQTGCRAPYGLLLQDHGFGGNYNEFGSGGLMERIAKRTGVFPEWMLSDRAVWTGFNRVPSVDGSTGGVHNQERFLFCR